MKRLLALTLVLSFGLFALGCGGSGGGEKKPAAKPAAGSTTPAPAAPSAPAPGGMKK